MPYISGGERLQYLTVWESLKVKPVSAGRGVHAPDAECRKGEQWEKISTSTHKIASRPGPETRYAYQI